MMMYFCKFLVVWLSVYFVLGIVSFIYISADYNVLMFLAITLFNIIILMVLIYTANRRNHFVAPDIKISKRRLLILLILSVAIISFDTGFFWEDNYDWLFGRMTGGYLTSVSLMMAFLISGHVVTYNLTDPYLHISFLLLLFLVYLTGSRLLLFSFFTAFLFNNYSLIIKNGLLMVLSLLSMLAFPFMLRYLRDGRMEIESWFSIFAGELDIFLYIQGAVQISSDYLYLGQSFFYNFLSIIGPFRRILVGSSFQERLWSYHYDNNHLGLADESSNQVLVDVGGYGSHHPTYVYEYYDYFGYLGSVVAIPYCIVLIYVLSNFVPSCLKNNGFLNVVMISSALFVVRGNSVIAVNNFIVAIVASYVLYLFLSKVRK